jgi:hypothetical protein
MKNKPKNYTPREDQNMSEQTEQARLTAWLNQLDQITYNETGLSYKDLPDQLFKDWFEDGLTPEDAYYQMMENSYPGTEFPTVYTQEFDSFTDADPGL